MHKRDDIVMHLFSSSRLYFREITPDDAEAMYELNLDPLIEKYTLDPPFESVEAAGEFWKNYDQYKKYGMGRWAVVLKSTNEVIGWCGLRKKTTYVDVGFRLIPRYRGKGYATEAGIASIQYGFENLGLTEIIGSAMKTNIASTKVLEKCGMTFLEEIDRDEYIEVRYCISKTN